MKLILAEHSLDPKNYDAMDPFVVPSSMLDNPKAREL